MRDWVGVSRRGVACVINGCIWAAMVGGYSQPASAQDKSAPSALYFLNFGSLYDGDFADAEKAFNDDLKGGIKTLQTRWIDSICYHTMCGEAAYYQGKYSQAMDHYNAAVKLYIGYPTWLLQVSSFPPVLQPSSVKDSATWGKSKRGTRMVKLPQTMSVSIGKIDNSDVVQKGGVVMQAVLYQVTVQEIWRTLALALHRRREILGPICQYDPLSAQIVQTLSARGLTPANHWSESWVFACRGLALAGLGRLDEALRDLDNSLLIGGQYDHPLTPLALLEMGIIMKEKGDLRKATELLEEASYAAADAGDSLIVEEAFRHAFVIHLVNGGRGQFAPLKAAQGWAQQRKAGRFLQCSLLQMTGENLAVNNETAAAASVLGEVQRLTARRQISSSDLGAQINYASAIAQYQRGGQAALKAGDEVLAAALKFKQAFGLWNYQIYTLDALTVGPNAALQPRVAAPIYEKLLRDPQAEDWNLRPLESLSVLLSPNVIPFEHWYEISLNNKQFELALEIGDRMRRRKFFGAIPGGGRLTALRWLLEGPETGFDKATTLQKQDLLAKYSTYKEWSAKAKTLRTEIGKLPLVPESQEALKKQSAMWDELAKLSLQQETKLHEIAIRRDPCPLLFPPIRKTKDVQAALPKGHVMLVFLQTTRAHHAYLIANDRYTAWEVRDPVAVENALIQLAPKVGLYDPLREVPLKDLTSDAWKKSAKDLLDTILAGNTASAGTKVNLGDKFEELVIVPDGIFWHVPFELLQVTTPTGTKSLLSHCRIRYAPTMGLAVTDQAGRRPPANNAIVPGKLSPKEDAEQAAAALDQYRKGVPGSVVLKTPLPASSSLYRSAFNGLMIQDDLTPQGGILELAPIAMDKVRSNGALVNWMSLPLGGPDYILMPAFHTRLENGLKDKATGYSSHDMFLAACSLMSQGTRTVLMSRWRPGGQSSYDLMREFAKELPHTTAADAWQRSVQLVTSAPLTLDQEPRVPKTNTGEPPSAEHPFFWAGFMMFDPGVKVDAAVPAAEKAAAAPGKAP